MTQRATKSTDSAFDSERAGAPATPESSRPLCVDLDGTVVRCDVAFESAIAFIRRHPLQAWKMAVWAMRGRASLKHRLAVEAPIEVDTLPYETALIERLRRERDSGRKIVMTTAADRVVAERVASHLGIFDEVIASDGVRNLKSGAKLEAIESRFPRGEFDFAGNDLADLKCLAAARKAIAVNPSLGLKSAIRAGRAGDVEVIEQRNAGRRTVMRAMRVYQWVKNLLLLLPIALAHKVGDRYRMLAVILGVIAFSLASSASYIFNDLLDVEPDRRHPEKRYRPFASGDLSAEFGGVLAGGCLLGAALLALMLGADFVEMLAIYVVTTAAYSFALKRVVLFDVFVLAGLYTIRVIAGGAAARVEVSQWMLAFSMFFFLGLAFLKRYAELHRLARNEETNAHGRGYKASDAEQIRILGIASGFMAVLVLALYLNSPAVAALYSRPTRLWFSCVFVAYWTSRVWLLADRGLMHEDPVVFATRDWVTYLLMALTGLTVALAL